MKSLVPVIVVDRIEPCLPFWMERLGFAKVAEVPHGDALGFVILAREGVSVMYQTRDSVAEDVPALADEPAGRSIALFITVNDLDAIDEALEGIEHVVPRRRTFYGTDELIVREPSGSVVTFARHMEGQG